MGYGYKAIVAILFLLTLSSIFPELFAAEQYAAGIIGRVTTLDGALVAGVDIHFSQDKKKLATKAITDSKGEYWLEFRPGIYDVSVELPSFKSAKRKNIKVEINGKTTIDFVLKPGRPVVVCDHP